jgi:hypothetical protein
MCGVAKCLIDTQNEYMMAALTNDENEVHWVQQKVKKRHQLPYAWRR